MNKKGQISLFIIIGVILVIISVVFISLTSANKKDNLEIDNSINFDLEKKQVSEIIDSCLEKSSTDAIYYLGKTGMMIKDINSLEFNEKDYLTFYNAIPTVEKIEISLNEITRENFKICFNEFNSNYSFFYDFKDLEVKSKINGNNIKFDLVLPMAVNTSNGIFHLEDFNYLLNYDLNNKYDVVKDFLEIQNNDLSKIYVTDLFELAKENEFIFEIDYVTQDDVLFTFIFSDFVKAKPFKYSFLIKFNWEEENE